MTTMNEISPARARELWVEALLSGKYEQCEGNLCLRRINSNKHSFCCLGVACELYIEHHPNDKGFKKLEPPDNHITVLQYSDDKYNEIVSQTLPTIVCKWLGLDKPSAPLKNPVDNYRNLIALNDSGATFQEIAQVIKNQQLLLAEEEIDK